MFNRTTLAFALGLICCAVLAHSYQMVGGLRDEREADEEVRKIVANLKSQIEQSTRQEFKTLEPISYRTQVVAGMNYFIKARATAQDGSKSHVHLRIYKPFRGDVELTAVRAGVDEKKPLSYFQ